MKRSKYSYYENAIQLCLNDGMSAGGIAKDLCSGDEDLVYNPLRCHINEGIKSGRYTTTTSDTDSDTDSDTTGDDYKQPHAFGQAFTDYCSRMQINPENVESAKAINHLAGGQEFNIVLKSAVSETDGIDFDEIIEAHAERLKGINWGLPHVPKLGGDNVGFINLNDLHLGMNPNEGGTGLSGEWLDADYKKAIDDGVGHMLGLNYSQIHVNIIGDILDGQDKKTTRGKTGESGHTLPQNKTNIEQFEDGALFITHLVSAIRNRFKGVEIIVHALSNSNHGGDMEYFCLRIAQTNLLYMFNIRMDIERKATMNYKIKLDGERGAFKDVVLMHGKDEKYQRRGLPYEIGGELMHDLSDLMKANGADNPKPLLFRADLHQAKVSHLRKFTDILCPAWCPSSQYAQANYFNYERGSVMCASIDIKTQQLITYVTQF